MNVMPLAAISLSVALMAASVNSAEAARQISDDVSAIALASHEQYAPTQRQSTAPMLTLAAACSPASSLSRRADWQMQVAAPEGNPWAEIRSVEPRSPAARARLKAGDRIVEINGVPASSANSYDDARRATRGGVPVRLKVEREGKQRDVRFTPRALPLEADPALKIDYEFITTGAGYRLRTIMTRPAGANGPLPSLILVPWLSCGSVEVFNKPLSGMDRLLAGILRDSGFLTMRVDKPGVGDSEGPPCSQADLKAEIAGVLLALEQLKSQPDFDRDRLFVMGMSLGGGLAPLIAQDEQVRGIVSVVGVVKTWFEHMMEIERRRLTLSGRPAAEVNDAMSGYAQLYTEYLIRGKTPGQVVTERPELKGLWTDEPGSQYGRPALFYSQLQTLNLEGAWQKVSAPTLIVAGEYDWIMSQDDYDLMASLVNRNTAGAATLIRWPRASHELIQYASREAAFNEEGGTFDDSLIALVVKWLKDQAAR
jgi:pimeloyl-ACP methyl ester carboxylesterase